MSDLGLYIAASALDAQQIGMNAVAQDLANVNTPQYAREAVNMTALAGGTYTSGAGVTVPSVTQITSSVTTAAMITADGLLSQSQAENQVLSQAQSFFQEPNGNSIQSQLSTFWSNWDTVANNPSDAGARQSLVASAQQVSDSLTQSYNSLLTTQSQTVSNLAVTITQANTLLGQVANLNQQIVVAQAGGGDANSLIDQRRQLLDQLSQSIGTTYRNNPDGAATVYLGGLELVQDNSTLAAAPPTPIVPLTVTTTGSGPTLAAQVVYTAAAGQPSVPAPPLGGTSAGLIAAIGKLGGYLTNLNSVASTLASNVNNQQASGYYWAGAAASAPSASGTTPYAGNVDTTGNPLNVFVDSLTGSSVGVDASNIGVDSVVTANPFYVAASNQNTLASTESVSPTLPSTAITPANNTIVMSLSVGGLPAVSRTLTIPAAAYTPANLAAAIQTQLDAQFGAGQATATINSAGYLVISATATSSPVLGPPPTGSTLQITNGTALATLGLSVMAIPNVGTQEQNNGVNAAQMAELANSKAGPDPIYQSFISQLGTDVSTSNTQLQAQTSETNAADKTFQALSGVSSDAETVAMQTYQNAYEAAAKVIATAQTMFQSLLAAV